MPVSILEAFASGLPVVTTDAGGIPYIVRHEQTGLVSNTEDWRQLAASCRPHSSQDSTLARRLTVERISAVVHLSLGRCSPTLAPSLPGNSITLLWTPAKGS